MKRFDSAYGRKWKKRGAHHDNMHTNGKRDDTHRLEEAHGNEELEQSTSGLVAQPLQIQREKPSGRPHQQNSAARCQPTVASERRRSMKRHRAANSTEARSVLFRHPFPTEYGDHFETPMQAYRDINGALTLLARKLGKRTKYLRIWDPFYCAGRTSQLLGQLGFLRVEHRNEDFYKVIDEGTEPPYDVLVTNPPYSGDHKQRCLQYCRESGKPWFLLIPSYVATKDYYKMSVLGDAAGAGGEPFYVIPSSRYDFDHPEGTGHADSPFSGIWFVQCGAHTAEVFVGMKAASKRGITVVRSLEELGQEGAVKKVRRLNPRQRKALKMKMAARVNQ